MVFPLATNYSLSKLSLTLSLLVVDFMEIFLDFSPPRLASFLLSSWYFSVLFLEGLIFIFWTKAYS